MVDWIYIVQSVGFPIVVAGYFMYTIPKMTAAIEKNSQAVSSLVIMVSTLHNHLVNTTE